ncbi:MAG: methyl-accepting chemotaxis protein [Treponema sp.]|nr:methyl-accepting chemotaxis protein [Treponema sp.]
MENSNQNQKQNQEKNRSSIKSKVLIFSAILFAIIFITGSIVYVFVMSQTVRVNIGHELVKEIEIERIKLEASVNGEIALALKMATSPLIIQHFLNPSETDLRRIAFAEIAGYRDAFRSKGTFWVSDIDKEFYFSEESHYTVDADDPDNYWYKMTLYETEEYNFNINYNAEANVTNLWINAPVFDSRRTPIGLVGTGIGLTEFINSIYQNYSGDAALFLFNNDGEITGAQDSKLIADKVLITSHFSNIGTEIFTRAKLLKDGEYVYFETSEGVVAVGKVPALEWYIVAIQKIKIMDILGSNMTFLFLAMIVVIAIILLIFYIYIRRLITPMNNMVKTLDHISVDWDLTERFNLKRNDEIGTLGDYFNLTFDKMRELLLSIKDKTISLTDTGDELTSYMTITKKDIDGIHNSIQHMRERVLTQSDNVNSAAGSMERIIKGIDELNGHITVQADSVAQSSSAIEEMLANIQSVTQTLVKNSANIHSLAESSGAGRTDLHKVSTDIQDIAQESEGLLQINSVMQTIASQTNLLAMNAAIEAAHAGDSGKGFAVVADEIRKLAENSGKQSKTISAVLKRIKTMIDAITKSTSIVLERFETIEKEVQVVSDQEVQIRNAMEEQGEGSRQILDAVTQLNSVTGLVRKSSTDMTSESREVLNQSTSLKKITGEVAGDMDEMTVNADEITSAFTRVQEITEENRENIIALGKVISRFKVER